MLYPYGISGPDHAVANKLCKHSFVRHNATSCPAIDCTSRITILTFITVEHIVDYNSQHLKGISKSLIVNTDYSVYGKRELTET